MFAQRINESSSTLLPLTAIKLLSMTLMIDMVLEFTCSFFRGYLGVAVLNCMFHFAKKFRVGVLLM